MRFIFFFLISLISLNALSQKYFQQFVDYNIKVKLDDINNKLIANETIKYTNNSNDTLTFLYFHLWPNAYKNNNTAFAKQQIINGNTDFYYAPDSLRGYISNLCFSVDNKKIKWELDSQYIDIAKLILNKPLLPKQSITIHTPFLVKIPGTFSRLGHSGQSYQITQWYPKPAVYDNKGWHAFPYLDQGEFYSEFGNFKVSITIPKNYVVGATGNLKTKSEINWLNKKVEETKKIKKYNYNDNSFPKSNTEFKTLVYTEKNIHDFAWFADKRYHVLKGKVTLSNGKKVTTWVMFTNNEADIWKDAIKYVNNGVSYYSKWIGNYPFNNCTAVDGSLGAGGGMEYPTITNIGYSGDAETLETTIVHEIGHNWFYSMLGSNERRFTWMDESINTFYEYRYNAISHPDNPLPMQINYQRLKKIFDLHLNHFSSLDLTYQYVAHKNIDQPLNLSAEYYTAINYGAINYSKGPVIFNYLMQYLGKEKFDNIMHIYFNKWKFKHPYPEDLKQIFIQNTTKNLSWFFDDLINTTKTFDYKIKNLKTKKNNYIITIKNKGYINSPFLISYIKNDSVIKNIWSDGFAKKKQIKLPKIDFDKISINYCKSYGEYNQQNNTIRKHGILKKTEPLKLQLLGSLNNPQKTNIYYFPLIAWNNNNKFMSGIALYNNITPQKKIEYQLAPLYSFNNKTLAGFFNISAFINPNKIFNNIEINANTKQFAIDKNTNYRNINLNLIFKLNKKDLRSKITNKFKLSTVIATDYLSYLTNKTNYNYIHILTYSFNNKNIFTPFNFNLSIEGKNNYLKTYLSGNFYFNYRNKNKKLSIRFFAGNFIYNNSQNPIYNFNLSGNKGYQDYLYNNLFLGRYDTDINNVYSHQFAKDEGGFNIYTPIQSSKWLTSINITSSMPYRLAIQPYLNIGATENIDILSKNNILLAYEAGIQINIIRDIFVIYFPIAFSNEIKTTNNIYTDNYFEKIRFTLNITKINPFKLIKDLDLEL